MSKIFFLIKDINNDQITAVNGTSLPSSLTPAEYVAANTDASDNVLGSWWIEQDTAGVPVLCTYCPMGGNIILSITGAHSSYTVERSDFIQDHPIHYPR